MRKPLVLSLWRPWTTLILTHGKNVENRTWNTDYRGDLLLAGGLHFDTKLSWPVVAEAALAGGGTRTAISRDPARHPTGIVGVVDLYDVCTAHLDGKACDCGPWAMAGHCHWKLRNPRPFLTPVPHRGFQKLHKVPDASWPHVARRLRQVTEEPDDGKCVACDSTDIDVERQEAGNFLRCYDCGYTENLTKPDLEEIPS